MAATQPEIIHAAAQEVLHASTRAASSLFVVAARHRRADGHVAQVDRLLLPVRHHRPLRRHRHHEPHGGGRRVLRGGPARAGVLQRHGDRRGLDERGVVHRHGRHALPRRLRRARRSSWAGPAATCWWRCSSRRTCASSASSRFPTSSARATAATSCARIGIFAAILCSFTYVVAQIYGVGLITSRFTGLEFGVGVFVGLARHPGLLVPRRHEGGDLDPGGAVHHPDHRLPDPGGLAVA